MLHKEKKDKLPTLRPAEDVIDRRLTIACRGPEFTRKTTFAFTAPDPIAYFGFEKGDQGVVSRFKKKKIDAVTLRVPSGQIVDNVDRMLAKAGPIWDHFEDMYREAVESGKYRTVIWDKGEDVYDLARLAKLGTLSNDDLYRFQYGQVNMAMKSLIKLPMWNDVNLIIIQESRPKYDKHGKETKETMGAGYKGTAALCQITLEFNRKKEDFWFEVDKCRPNSELSGQEFRDDEATFSWLAAMAVEGTSPEDWE